MALLQYISKEQATDDVKEVMNGFSQAVGDVPKPLQLIANSPGLFIQQVGLISYYRNHPNFDHTLLACIRYLAASLMGYDACIEFNGNLLIRQGMSQHELEAMTVDWMKAPLEEKELALLHFALHGLQDPDAARAEDIENLKRLGWTEADIIDSINISFSMLTHGRMMRYFQMAQ